jgi:hypothetical protein
MHEALHTNQDCQNSESTIFSISSLIDLFRGYATHLKELRHNESSFKERCFFNLDFEELQNATREGCKYPLMLFQTPDTNKNGGVDNISESWEGSYIILDQLRTNKADAKAEAINTCKLISDKILRRMVADAPEFFDGGLIQTTEGIAGPTSSKLYGWVVTFTFDKAFDGEVNAEDWEDLSCQ